MLWIQFDLFRQPAPGEVYHANAASELIPAIGDFFEPKGLSVPWLGGPIGNCQGPIQSLKHQNLRFRFSVHFRLPFTREKRI